MDVPNLSHLHLKTCNNILEHFCTNSKGIGVINVEMENEAPSKAAIQKHFAICLDYLVAQKILSKVNDRGYELTKEGKSFYKKGGFLDLSLPESPSKIEIKWI